MRQKLNKENINTVEYLNKLYATPDYLGPSYNDARERLRLIVDKLTRAEKHLDIGCADGTFTKYYLDKYPDTQGFGMDISEEALKLASINCPGAIFSSSIPKRMDLIHCGEVLEHIEDPQYMIDTIYSSLNPNGLLVITTPNELAGDYEEHLWKWDMEGVCEMLHKFKITQQDERFFNGNLLYIEAKKL